jgi:hypothetical protein
MVLELIRTCGGVLLGSKIGKGKNVCDKPNGNLFPLQP